MGDDDELSIASLGGDVLSNNGSVVAVEGGVDFVHEVEGIRFVVMESKHE